MGRHLLDPVAPVPPGTASAWRRELRSVGVAGSVAIAAAAITATVLAAVAGAPWRDAVGTLAAIGLLATAVGVLWLIGRAAVTGGPDVELPGAVTLLVLDTGQASGAGRASVSRMWALDTDLVGLARALVLGVTHPASPLDAAVLAWASSLGLDPSEVAAALPQVDQVPYDADRRRLTTVHDTGAGYLVVCRGAPEVIWPLLVTASDGTCAARAQAEPLARAWAAAGLRVMAVATTSRRVVGNSAGRLESALRLRGLIGFDDAVPPGDREAVTELAGLGVGAAVVSADPRGSVLAAAARIGLVGGVRGSGLVTGAEVAAGSWPQDVRVFAAVAPQQHAQLVAHWRASGEVVADPGSASPAASTDPIGLVPRIRASRHARDAVRRGAGVLAVAVLTMLALLVAGAASGDAPWLTPTHVLWTVLAVAAPIALAYRREPLDAAAAGSPRGHSRLFPLAWCRRVVAVSVVLLGWALVAWSLGGSAPVADVLFAAVAAAVIGVGAGTRSRPAGEVGGRIWVDATLAAVAVGTVLLADPTWAQAVLGVMAAALGYGVARIVRIR